MSDDPQTYQTTEQPTPAKIRRTEVYLNDFKWKCKQKELLQNFVVFWFVFLVCLFV